jgi:hypothetical protein
LIGFYTDTNRSLWIGRADISYMRKGSGAGDDEIIQSVRDDNRKQRAVSDLPAADSQYCADECRQNDLHDAAAEQMKQSEEQ